MSASRSGRRTGRPASSPRTNAQLRPSTVEQFDLKGEVVGDSYGYLELGSGCGNRSVNWLTFGGSRQRVMKSIRNMSYNLRRSEWASRSREPERYRIPLFRQHVAGGAHGHRERRRSVFSGQPWRPPRPRRHASRQSATPPIPRSLIHL